VERVQWWGARRRTAVYVPFSVNTMALSGEHRAFIVEKFIKNGGSTVATQRAFRIRFAHGLRQACQTECPPRATWVTFVLSRGPNTTTNCSHLIKIIAEYFYYLNLETYNVHTNALAASHIHQCEVMK
jgi:hypothetical protein